MARKYASVKQERPKQARVYLTGRKGRRDKYGRQVNMYLDRATYDRLEQIAVWEGRLPVVVAEMLMHLGFEVYGCLLDHIAGAKGTLTMPEGMPAVPGMETLIEAVGRGMLVREAARKAAQRSAEIVEEQRRDRERANA